MRFVGVLVGLIIWLKPAIAGEIFPVGCVPVEVHEEYVKLTTGQPALVMIHNLSNVDLWITHPLSEPSASAGWSSHLQSGHWSALALDKKTFDLSCIESKPGHEQQVPCAGLLSVCQYPNVKASSKNQDASGTFWAGEDLPLSGLIAHVGSRGFKVPSPKQSMVD